MKDKISDEAVIQRLRYSSGLVRVERLVLDVCQMLGEAQPERALGLIRDAIDRGYLSHTNVEYTVTDPETGEVRKNTRHIINQGYRQVVGQRNGSSRPVRLITNVAAIQRRNDECDGGTLPPRMKSIIDRCSTHLYRFNPTMLDIMGKITLPNTSGSTHDQARLMQEYNLMRQDGNVDFAQPLETERRRPRLHVKGVGGMGYQSSDLFRASIEATHGSKVSASSFEFMKATIGEGYDLTVDRADVIRAAGHEFFLNPEKYGVDAGEKKLASYFVQAEALSKASRGEVVHTFGRLDHTCSGYQIMAIMFGCAVLARATNLTIDKKHDLYTEVQRLASCPPQFAEWEAQLFIRNLSKDMVIRGGYGSSASGLASGLLLNDTDSEFASEVFDHNGILTDKAIRVFSGPQGDTVLNHDWSHIWKQCAGDVTPERPRGRWDILVEGIRDLARSFEGAINALSPRLQEGKQVVQKACKNIIDSGDRVRWTNYMGYKYELFAPEYDFTADSKRIVRKYKGGGRLDVYLKPIENSARVTQGLVDMVHGGGDAAFDQRGKELFFEELGIHSPYCITGDIHDSVAALYEYLPTRQKCQRQSVFDVAPSIIDIYNDVIDQGNINDPQKHGNHAWDRKQIFASKHFIGA